MWHYKVKHREPGSIEQAPHLDSELGNISPRKPPFPEDLQASDGMEEGERRELGKHNCIR